MKERLLSTKNYILFSHHENQQPVSEVHVQKIAASMREHGFFPSKPIQVYKGAKGCLHIIDGHHRFEAAKILGIDVVYVIEDSSHAELIGQINFDVRKWSALSFVKLYASKGNKDYLKVLEYCDKGLPIRVVASLLANETTASGNQTNKLREGKFKVKSTEKIDLIIGLIDSLGVRCPELKKQSYIEAVIKLLYVEDFDLDQLKRRIISRSSDIIPVSSWTQALDLLDEVYNFGSRVKVNVAFLAKQAARERSAIKGVA